MTLMLKSRLSHNVSWKILSSAGFFLLNLAASVPPMVSNNLLRAFDIYVPVTLIKCLWQDKDENCTKMINVVPLLLKHWGGCSHTSCCQVCIRLKLGLGYWQPPTLNLDLCCCLHPPHVTAHTHTYTQNWRRRDLLEHIRCLRETQDSLATPYLQDQVHFTSILLFLTSRS